MNMYMYIYMYMWCCYYERTSLRATYTKLQYFSNRPHARCPAVCAYLDLNWDMVVVYMDNTQGHAVDFFHQYLPVNLP